MSRIPRSVARVVLAGCVLASVALIAAETRGETRESVVREQAELPADQREELVADRDGITVYTGQATPATTGAITAYDADGRLLYFNETYKNYFDVDPVAGTRATVEYVATDYLSPAECNGETECVRNVFVRVNLSTGASERFYSRTYPKLVTLDGIALGGKVHDFDRVDEDHIAVADIRRDEVYVVNTSSGVRTWTWSARQSFSRATGGSYPDDWTHINDVEVLDDGRFMVSLRNFDRVLFLDRQGAVAENWTLGSQGEHETIYRQHNPDYINASLGGPAVVVADSENNRVLEYRREGGDWVQEWGWADSRLQWPRDADRLPDGHTLVTDTHGGRILEIDEQGETLWQVEAGTPYEAERLSTPPESEGSPSAARAGLGSRGDTAPVTSEPGGASLGWLRNVAAFVLPNFFTVRILLATVALVGSATALAALELYWLGWGVSLSFPVKVRRQ